MNVLTVFEKRLIKRFLPHMLLLPSEGAPAASRPDFMNQTQEWTFGLFLGLFL